MEALMLRFALAEKFLNVEQLLSNGSVKNAPSVKKKTALNTVDRSTATTKVPQSSVVIDHSVFESLDSISSNWERIVGAVTTELGSGTGGLLGLAKPVGFENDVLTVAFDYTAKGAMELCQSNGRAEQIENYLSKGYGKAIKLKTTLIDNGDSASQQPKGKMTVAQRNEIMNDPAVKTILTQLGATVTGIEQ
jgi:hypothetical protein